MKIKLFATVLIFTSLTAFCQTYSPDTVNIYLTGSSISLKKLKKLWFPMNGSFSLSIVTRQDLVITNDSSYYFKVYDRNKKLVLEGKKGAYQQMTGLVKFYYADGSIERTEFYRADNEIPDSTRISYSDGTTPWGTWTYYNKNGQVFKTILYSAEKSTDNTEICEIITTTIFNRDNVIKSRQRKKKECRKNNSI